MRERWRPVVGWEGWYEVSDRGRVRRTRGGGHGAVVGRVLKQNDNGHGYLSVQLSRDGQTRRRYVHALVAEAFLGPCPPDHEVNHKKGKKSDNRASQLEWGTRLHNVRHAMRTGLSRWARGEDHGSAKLTDERVREILTTFCPGESRTRFAAKYGVSLGALQQVLERRTWKHIVV